jgi:hypothetical protein
VIDYESFAADTDAVLADILKRFGLSPLPPQSTSGSVPNSSFDSVEARKDYFSSFQHGWISLLGGMMHWIPYPLFAWSSRRSWNRLGPIVPGTFDNIHRRMPELRERFRKTSASTSIDVP